MGFLRPPISTNWRSLSAKQAGALLACGLALEFPIRFWVRPDMSDLVPGNPWFQPWLRLGIEAGMFGAFLLIPVLLRVPYKAAGIPRRRWTRWEWLALLIVGAGELIVVGVIAGSRWLRLWNISPSTAALAWVVGEFFFGMNQETGYRGLIMTGLLRLRGLGSAYAWNMLLFLVGPLHGPGIIDWIPGSPGAALGYAAGVIVHGLAYSWLRHRTDNVVLCAVLHGIINASINGPGLALRFGG